MLLQSSPDTMYVLPALPSSWKDISVRGLCAMGNRKVNIKVKNGKLVACEIIGAPPAKIYVCGEDCMSAFVQNNEKILVKPVK